MSRREGEERAPLFGRWIGWYALMVAELAAIILFCGWLASLNG